jgi:hypothetical protein
MSSNVPKEFQDALDAKIKECMIFIHEKFQEMEFKLKNEMRSEINKKKSLFPKWWK